MKLTLATCSLILFGSSCAAWSLVTALESSLIGMSLMDERIITFGLLVLPATIGAMLAAMSLVRKVEKTGLAVAGIIWNALFAIFHLMVILFAG